MGEKPVQDFEQINNELEKYSDKLINKKQIVVANKIDIMQDRSELEELKKKAKEKNLEFFEISGATRQGVDELMEHLAKVLKTLPKEDIFDNEEKIVYTLEEKDGFTIEKIERK